MDFHYFLLVVIFLILPITVIKILRDEFTIIAVKITDLLLQIFHNWVDLFVNLELLNCIFSFMIVTTLILM